MTSFFVLALAYSPLGSPKSCQKRNVMKFYKTIFRQNNFHKKLLIKIFSSKVQKKILKTDQNPTPTHSLTRALPEPDPSLTQA